MKNHLSFFLASKIRIKVTGKNTDKFIRKLVTAKVELLNIKHLKRNCTYIWIYKKDYPTIDRLKTIYDFDVVDAAGWIKIRKVINVNKYFIFSLIIGLACLIILTNLIFKVEVIHNNKDIRDFIINELREYGIDKYKFKKNFKDLNKIKESILLEFKDKIEWLEIETVGVKYVVRIELREIIDKPEPVNNRDVVALKDATIKKITAYSGQVVKTVNSYVKKGDTIISGVITLNDNTKGFTAADGKIYGEVWYNMTVEYPFTYYEEKYTGKKNHALVFKFLNWNFSIPKNKFYKTVEEKIILKNDLFPLSLTYETQKEVEIIDQVLTEEQAIEYAIQLAKDKMIQELDKDEYIISQKNLKIDIKDSKIVLDSFFVVYENITDYKEINEEMIEETKVD